MTPRFRATLRNGTAAAVEGVMPPTFWEKFVELNREMLRANSTLKKEHRWASHWWEWPLMLKTILYWRANGPPYVTAERPHARIYCIGTPAVWWLGAIAPLLFVVVAAARWFRPPEEEEEELPAEEAPVEEFFEAPAPAAPAVEAEGKKKGKAKKGKAAAEAAAAEAAAAEAKAAAEAAAAAKAAETQAAAAAAAAAATLPAGGAPWGALLLVGFLANLLPFAAVQRVAFLYHHLPALLHALLLLGVTFDLAVPRRPLVEPPVDAAEEADPIRAAAAEPSALRWLVAAAVVAIFAAAFAFFAPLVYGVPLSHAALASRDWLPGWIEPR